MDLSQGNVAFSPEVYMNMNSFCAFIDDMVGTADYGIGGYGEDREMYARSAVFDGSGEPRRIHLGVDVWGAVGTPVSAPLDGVVHSIGMHQTPGDYGGTVILRHELDGLVFHTLYGHLSAAVTQWTPGALVRAGNRVGFFGALSENGFWPPHLHFQVVLNMEGMHGDYPGVCRRSEQERYLSNCPDPMPLLGFDLFPA
jgi:murein DD-endopeptidase MepM/ murein hydrolase activator NlpD